MKRLLLLTTAAVAATSMWAEQVIYEYDYNNWKTYNVEYDTIVPANYPQWHNNYAKNNSLTGYLNYEKNWDEDYGLMVLGHGTSSNISTIKSSWPNGTQIVNLGGTVGKVLCISAANSDIVDALQTYDNSKFAALDDNWISTGATFHWVYVHWYVDSLTYTSSGASGSDYGNVSNIVRVDILLNLYESDYANRSNASSRIGSFYGVNANGVIFPSGTSNDAVNATEFWTDSSDEETWSPDIWMKYTFYTWSNYIPFSVCMFLNNGGASPTWTLFIKSITFTQLENTDDVPDSFASTKTMYTDGSYYIEPITEDYPTGIAQAVAEEAPAYKVTGQDVTFGEYAMIYSASGALVGYAQAGETKTLPKGFYIARVGGQGVKFAVK